MTESVVTAAPQRTGREIAQLMRERNVGAHVAAHGPSPVITAEAGMDVEEAGELMVRHAIRRLVVVDGGRLTGIVTLDDLASRTGDAKLASQLAGRVTRAVMPDFFFHERG